MTEETLLQANQIVLKIHDLEKKIELVNKGSTYTKKLLIRAKYSGLEESFYIPDYLNEKFTEELVMLLKTTLNDLKNELAAL